MDTDRYGNRQLIKGMIVKSILLNDEGCDPTSATPAQQKLFRWVVLPGRKAPVCIYPKGTIFEGEQAVFLVQTGQASPVDDECREACGMSKEQMEAAQIGNVMNLLGINDEKHRELYAGGVFTGWDANGKMIPGPNWDSYKAALKELELEDELE